MAAYADRSGLTDRFGESEIALLEDPDNAGFPNELLSAKALSDASEEINSYIAVRYSLPLPSTPDPVIRACCDIARFRLYKDRPTDEVKYRYEQTVEWLRQIAVGKAVLVFSIPLTEQQKEEIKGPSVSIGTTYNMGVFSNNILDKMPKF